MFPAAAVPVVYGVAKAAGASGPVLNGVALGLGLAVLQSYLSTVSLWLSRRRIFLMMSLWVAGILFRLAFLVFVAYRVHDNPAFGFTATLSTMVLATMVFTLVEAETALKG